MKAFLSRFGSPVLFTFSGFDRLRFCGESRLLNHPRRVQSYLHQQRIFQQQGNLLSAVDEMNLAQQLLDEQPLSERRRQGAQVTRWLALLRGQGLRGKVQKTHRYQLGAFGQRVTMALLAAHAKNVHELTAA